ncbi:hypothetical protein MD484_g7836, partial [Candolleomyces efflorescens]
MAEFSFQDASKDIGNDVHLVTRFELSKGKARPPISDKSTNVPFTSKGSATEKAKVAALTSEVEEERIRALQARLKALAPTAPEITSSYIEENEGDIINAFWKRLSEVNSAPSNGGPFMATAPVQDESHDIEMSTVSLFVEEESAPVKSLKIILPPKRSAKAKAQPSKRSSTIKATAKPPSTIRAQSVGPPSPIKAGPVAIAVPAKLKRKQIDELDRKGTLNGYPACQLVTNSKHIVYCRPCKIPINLERRSVDYGGYYSSQWTKHSISGSHRSKEREWIRCGHNIPKEQDQQWKAVGRLSEEKYPDGTLKMSYHLEAVAVDVDAAEAPGSAEEANTV